MKVRSKIKKMLTKVFSFGKPKKQILFESFGGAQYSADPRAISEKMHELYPEIQIVWYIDAKAKKDNNSLLPNYVKVVDNKLSYIYALAKSMAYVTTQPLTESFYKRRGQFVVQTWHGDRGLKKVLYEATQTGKVRAPILDNVYTDICVAASDIGESVYRTAFRYDGEIVKVGMPRNDKLVSMPIDLSVYRKRLGIPEGVKVLLYAPTFRGSTISEQKAMINLTRCLDILEEKGEKWIGLVRAHEYSKKIVHDTDERIYEVSLYPDMADILLITDILITDYSSCACDFVLTHKPVILAVNDVEQYQKESRHLKVNLEDTGFVLSYSEENLEKLLMNLDIDMFVKASDRVIDFFGIDESGNASEIICKRIYNACLG